MFFVSNRTGSLAAVEDLPIANLANAQIGDLHIALANPMGISATNQPAVIGRSTDVKAVEQTDGSGVCVVHWLSGAHPRASRLTRVSGGPKTVKTAVFDGHNDSFHR